jgi:hypothetical protein
VSLIIEIWHQFRIVLEMDVSILALDVTLLLPENVLKAVFVKLYLIKK